MAPYNKVRKTLYIATDNPLKPRPHFDRQILHYKTYGPPSPNYWQTLHVYSTKAKGKMVYADHSVQDTIRTKKDGDSNFHPCSPEGLSADPPPNFLPELKFHRTKAVGFFDPPLMYMSGQFKWEYHDSWENALAAALTQKGCTYAGEQMTGDDVQTIFANIEDSSEYKNVHRSHTLHHPADRDFVVFKDEPKVAAVARYGAAPTCYGLVIVCPLIRSSGTGWDCIWDQTNRPPMMVRHSVGDQGVYEPLLMGYLPQCESTHGRESYHKTAL
jgi:hypothetical protein